MPSTRDISPHGQALLRAFREAAMTGEEEDIFRLIDALAQDEVIPLYDLTAFSVLHFPAVRLGVAQNRRTPPPVLRWLWENGSHTVKSMTVANPTCPSWVLNRAWAAELAWAKENPNLLNTCEEFVSRPDDVTEQQWREADDHVLTRFGLADNPSSHRPDLTRLARLEQDVRVLSALAANVSSPPLALKAVIKKARAGGHPEVRVGVAQNPSAPPDVLTLLAKDEDLPVRVAVSWHPSTPEDIRSSIDC
ncbi:hypothetical protein FQ330_03205 [Agrococcus sediminis]|uniref:Uncharacterized protein n=1 Tax=Agrococcus sediminis TaxID=2599924 RepID=A0A5M8QNX3_9MICO|nr:hypothetical protein [Agrococcus sediminis]KAA6436426.1 hypothetical protein FQ330_03205 [Agrococcus sediminis]